jgi:hypothetical protein
MRIKINVKDMNSKLKRTDKDISKDIEILAPLSQEHKHAQMLCWKIREGIKRNVPLERIMAYANWYFNNQLVYHFEIEQKYIFPILGKDSPSVKKALSAQRKLSRLFAEKNNFERSLSRIEEELDFLVRFEEKVLFEEVKHSAGTMQLRKIVHQQPLNQMQWQDTFWL